MRICVVGHLTIDYIMDTTTSRISVANPQGAVLGAAIGARMNGAEVFPLAKIGSDYPRAVLDSLSEWGIDLTYCDETDLASLLYWAVRLPDDEVIDGVWPSKGVANFTPPIAGILPADWQQFDAVHLCPMPLDDQLRIARVVRPHVDLISVDPLPLSYDSTRSSMAVEEALAELGAVVDVVLLSEGDYGPTIPRSVEERVTLLRRINARHAILRVGADGSIVTSTGRGAVSVGSLPVEAVDTTGAGDLFAGGLLAALQAGYEIEHAVQIANSTAVLGLRSRGLLNLVGYDHEPASLAPFMKVTDLRG